MLSSQKAR